MISKTIPYEYHVLLYCLVTAPEVVGEKANQHLFDHYTLNCLDGQCESNQCSSSRLWTTTLVRFVCDHVSFLFWKRKTSKLLSLYLVGNADMIAWPEIITGKRFTQAEFWLSWTDPFGYFRVIISVAKRRIFSQVGFAQNRTSELMKSSATTVFLQSFQNFTENNDNTKNKNWVASLNQWQSRENLAIWEV